MVLGGVPRGGNRRCCASRRVTGLQRGGVDEDVLGVGVWLESNDFVGGPTQKVRFTRQGAVVELRCSGGDFSQRRTSLGKALIVLIESKALRADYDIMSYRQLGRGVDG
jgi:hypothetical protein